MTPSRALPRMGVTAFDVVPQFRVPVEVCLAVNGAPRKTVAALQAGNTDPKRLKFLAERKIRAANLVGATGDRAATSLVSFCNMVFSLLYRRDCRGPCRQI